MTIKRLAPFVALVAVAGCATRPQPTVPVVATPVVVQPQQRGDLIGLTAGELYQRLGTPALQVREGASLKLQFRSSRCVLDTYLYAPPQGGGPERVTYVDTRLPSGNDTDQRGCIDSLHRG